MPWKTLGVLAVFSPRAWRAAGKTAHEAALIVRNMFITAGVVVGAAVYAWHRASVGTRVVVCAVALLVAVLWFHSRRALRAVPKPVADEPTQVLYRWWEPDDLPAGTHCYCGKERRAGELIYVGITGAHRSRELDEDRRAACWWRDGIVGTTQAYGTRAEVEAAEQRAIRTEHPRENKVYNYR